jgi:ribosomal protein S18 acetylase RimI-like enzyme
MRTLPGGERLVDGQCRQALHDSLCFGAYLGALQIGLVRVVTDGAIFSSITDAYVDAAHRGKGIGSALMQAVVEHEAVAGTRCILQAKSTHWLFYFKWDFHVVDKAHGIMVRVGR